MDWEQARFNMVEQQIRPWDVLDQRILDLLFQIRREMFVEPASRELAFADLEIPIGHGETMLAPKLEARMVQELQLRSTDNVLEVGTGSGYMTALLAALTARVCSVEIEPALAAFGRANIEHLLNPNIVLEEGDGSHGWQTHAPYDAIVFTGSTPVLPASLLAQLAVGGRLLAVVGVEPVMTAQLVSCVESGKYSTQNLFETCIRPLRNAQTAARFVF